MEEKVPNKVPYVPSADKRYEVSKDEFSRRRIEALKDIQHELQAEFPMIPISISIFGSLVKGKKLTPETAPNADIDFDLKFDEDALTSLPREEALKIEKKFNIPDLGRFSVAEIFKDLLIEKLNRIKSELGLEEIPQKSFYANPIHDKSIQNAVSDVITAQKWSRKEVTTSADINLNLYFTLSIGSAVKKYRDKFLKELASSENKKEAEEKWNLIRDSVERNERQGQIPEKIKHRFPQTLAEALKFYGVK